MTRINLVPPSTLVDKHLVAEYRELPRIFALARAQSYTSPNYKLGEGHMLFFYNKLEFLYERQKLICEEMRKRGIAVNFPAEGLKDTWYEAKKHLWNNWTPTEAEIAVSQARIDERLKAMGLKKAS